ncbi:hypothetical protein P152DRAFT_480452 [Eremomyces bilateralis CBS 781.70]|uniref:Calcium-channel protein CCH1 n=1 Tax=Eremomyces bilateralis CBS 781.70 TaxID=1392243 RepID=A0A6G1G8L7_9PEZI|nr:uncharacterized protein P152DRAFT_480452 [Eremomyces bilateralis CBS 781.70]KAF1814240.1 hypothetical protein P152DRAFT_480452 [Eremomyces bilateralis CBS 781.70]
MDSHDGNHRRNASTPQTPQSIPLQDFNNPTQQSQSTGQRQRSITERGRDLLRSRDGATPRVHWGGGSYQPVTDDGSPGRSLPRIVTSNNTNRRPHHDADEASPMEDGVAFQSAIGGFAGLSFSNEDDTITPPAPSAQGEHTMRSNSVPSFLSRVESDSATENIDLDDPNDYFSPTYGDRTPLTTHLQPTGTSNPGGQQHDRMSSTNSFGAGSSPVRSARLGDDLNTTEAGLRTPGSGEIRRSSSFTRTLSPSSVSSPLHRAGTIMRQMSQRVVNLSNEPELVERHMRRKSSTHSTRRAQSPSHPTTAGYSEGVQDEEIPPEKSPAPQQFQPFRRPSKKNLPNPLRGRSLGIFLPDNKLRIKLCDILVHPMTEPCILLLIVIQTVLLAVDARQSVFIGHRTPRWGSSWIDYAMLALFCIYTAECFIRTIVSGFIVNPIEYSTVNRQVGFKKAVAAKWHSLFSPLSVDTTAKSQPSPFTTEPQPSIIRAFTATNLEPNQIADSRYQRRVRLAHRAFLRHSFNRLDFLAVVAYWITFAISLSGFESSKHAYVFRMLSCLRILRLLLLTSGTTVILRSLKKAAPLLVHVAFLIGFFWLLFAIVGVQAFKASLRRQCVWKDPEGLEEDFLNTFQFCGGYLDPNGTALSWLNSDLTPGSDVHKGYICPVNSMCIQGDNPFNGTLSFDNIFQSLELVFVVMSSNTWSQLMYFLTDSDYLAAALFFAAGIVILFLWLINLLIAVITSSFQVIRDESKASAFTAEEVDQSLELQDSGETANRKISRIKKLFDKTKWLWILIIISGTICQGLRSASMGSGRAAFVDGAETAATFILLLEIVLRFIVDWRHFFRSRQNIIDCLLAIITTVMQIPAIHNSGQPYAWLTIFQIVRFYRVVLAVPITRDLILTVLGNFSGLVNLILFVFLLTFLAAIFAVQMFRGEFPIADADGESIHVTFSSIYNSFLGMYQVLSSENWTTLMYNVTGFTVAYNTAWIGAAFFIIWFILANFIVLNMFIAVIQENFDVSEDEKRLQQVKAFLHENDLGGNSHGNLSLSTIFKVSLATGRRKDPLAFGTATTEMLLKGAVVRDFLDQQDEQDPISSPPPPATPQPGLRSAPTTVISPGTLSTAWGRFFGFLGSSEPNPFYSRLEFSRANEDLDPRQMAKEVVSARERRKKAQREYLLKHPSYNVSLYTFKPNNPIRKICQKIVGPGRGGDRIEGVAPSVPIWYAFSAFVYAAIVAMVLLACITTPLYQKVYFQKHPFSVKNWFVFTDMGFAVLFGIEAAIKVIADGFFWTPNAYFRGSWGFIDGIVLVTLWINVGTSLFNEGQVSRAVGAFKALRALRLLNVSDSARNTFHSIIVRGGLKILSAALVSLSLLIPFAIYGLNLFNGKLLACNDGADIYNLDDCVGEFLSSPYNWEVLTPRVVSNEYYSFDNFGDSLFILFQVVSQEGWTDVMWAAENIVGVNRQPQPLASQGNAIFFVVFNLLGAVFVLTLFVSVFMRNYTEQTGVAYLTTDQRSWLELRKLLRQVAPSKRPVPSQRRESWKEWCYRRAVRKSGRWQRFVTLVLVVHLILLCLEFFPGPFWWDLVREFIFLAFTLVYIANIAIRIVGLSWPRFRRSSWDLYSLISVSGAFITTIMVLARPSHWVYAQVHNFCLVSIALLLIPRNNQLDQLFKTAAASLKPIANLLATWFVLFLVYAIAFTQTFGLTKFGENQTSNINFRSVPKALILLFRLSIGEGWNELMEDFASIRPPNCVVGQSFSEGDCGSPEWARALFISWNILSMYIFVNLFVSLIYESFSYVYQRSSGLAVISREEIRRFKQAWAEFDPNGTGFISKEAFPRFLGELSGVFEMRIYDGDFTVRRLIEDCRLPARQSVLPVDDPQERPEMDLKKLNARLAELPVQEIRRRRDRMNKFYEEVLVSSDPDRGIGFNSLLMILAHYKVINDNKSLRLKEFLRRRARLQRVDEAVRRNIVQGFFDTVFWARRFRRITRSKDDGRMTAVPQFTVPEIYVDDGDAPTSPADTRQGASAGTGAASSHNGQFSYAPNDLHGSPRTPSSLSPRRGPGLSIDLGHTEGSTGSITPPNNQHSRANSIQLTPSSSPTRPGVFVGQPAFGQGNLGPQDQYGQTAPGASQQSWASRPSPYDSPRNSRPPSHERPISPLQSGSPGRDAASSPAHGPSLTAGGLTSSGLEPGGGRSRAGSAVSVQDVMDSLETSAWGESIRRSFTTRRGGNNGDRSPARSDDERRFDRDNSW